MTRPVFESYFEAEKKARRLTRRYVVVECRDEEDPPGVEATFVVCPEHQVHTVPNRREVVFIAEITQPAAHQYRLVLDNALLRLGDAIGAAERDSDGLRELLRAIRDDVENDLLKHGSGGR